jgi:hypothetical protein
MSKEMETAKENLETIIDDISDPDLKERISEIHRIISQNRKKIWLRTKTGKPMAEDMEKFSLNFVNSMKNSSDTEEAVKDLEAQAIKIEEETRRRSMVVT